MADNIKNLSASVHQRLLNKAKESSRTFNELLQHFAIERFIYRLSKSAYADRFILKGALMFSAWGGIESRPTMDIDLLGRIDNDLDIIMNAMKEACLVEVISDGMSFDPETVTAARITEDADYQGVRVRFQGNLGNARIRLQIDIGFGDVVVPGPTRIVYPVLLDFPAPEISGYTMESVIAEKYQAMVKLGVLNSRMKDFYDIWKLSSSFDFEGEVLSDALMKTFENRNMTITASQDIFDSLTSDSIKKIQWESFCKRTLLIDAPKTFEEVISAIRTFIEPLINSFSGNLPFNRTWKAPGPWNR